MAPLSSVPILARGRGWCVVDKPPGVPVTPGRTPGPNVEALCAGLGHAVAAAHRLDQDTSGCLLLALRRPALRALMAAFASGSVGKLYLAILEGAPAAPSGLVDAPLRKVSTAQDGWKMVVAASGKPARTHWERLWTNGRRSLVALRPETGRTHQLRVHAHQIAGPILGDPRYGGTKADRAGPGLMLQARALSFPDPDDPSAGRMIWAVAPFPERMRAALPPDYDLSSLPHAPGRSAAIMASAIRCGSMG
jgi:tRNA pseudouridine32 synthase/23S rRNA pseudouridine746 synthase